jgi:hypothetical protein
MQSAGRPMAVLAQVERVEIPKIAEVLPIRIHLVITVAASRSTNRKYKAHLARKH